MAGTGCGVAMSRFGGHDALERGAARIRGADARRGSIERSAAERRTKRPPVVRGRARGMPRWPWILAVTAGEGSEQELEGEKTYRGLSPA